MHGFRSNRSTSLALLELIEEITTSLDNKKATVGVFIDLKKAFDTIDHNLLSYNLSGLANQNQALRQTKKSCNVRGSTTRRDTTRQKSGLVVSDLTMLDICAKARLCLVVSRRVVHSRTLHDFLVGGVLCRVV